MCANSIVIKSEYNLESNTQKDYLHVVGGRSLFIAYEGVEVLNVITVLNVIKS